MLILFVSVELEPKWFGSAGDVPRPHARCMLEVLDSLQPKQECCSGGGEILRVQVRYRLVSSKSGFQRALVWYMSYSVIEVFQDVGCRNLSLWLGHPKISHGRVRGLMMFGLTLKDLFFFGSLFFFPRVFLVTCRYVIYVVCKESGDSRWRHQKVYNLWLQIYLSSCFQGWEFQWIWFHLTTCNDWKRNWMYLLVYIFCFLLSMFDRRQT